MTKVIYEIFELNKKLPIIKCIKEGYLVKDKAEFLSYTVCYDFSVIAWNIYVFCAPKGSLHKMQFNWCIKTAINYYCFGFSLFSSTKCCTE